MDPGILSQFQSKPRTEARDKNRKYPQLLLEFYRMSDFELDFFPEDAEFHWEGDNASESRGLCELDHDVEIEQKLAESDLESLDSE